MSYLVHFCSYGRIDTNENNMKYMWTVLLLTTNRKARNLCQDVDHCWDENHSQYHLGIDRRCQDETTVRLEMSPQMIRPKVCLEI